MEDESRIKLVAVGNKDCGKTAIIFCYVNNTTEDHYIPYSFDNYNATMLWKGRGITISCFDTSGTEGSFFFVDLNFEIEDYNRLRPLVFSLIDKNALEEVEVKWKKEIDEHCPGVPVVLVGSKKGLRDEVINTGRGNIPRESVVRTEEGKRMARKIRAARYVECSSRTQVGLGEIFREVTKIVMEARENPRRINRRRHTFTTQKLWTLFKRNPNNNNNLEMEDEEVEEDYRFPANNRRSRNLGFNLKKLFRNVFKSRHDSMEEENMDDIPPDQGEIIIDEISSDEDNPDGFLPSRFLDSLREVEREVNNESEVLENESSSRSAQLRGLPPAVPRRPPAQRRNEIINQNRVVRDINIDNPNISRETITIETDDSLLSDSSLDDEEIGDMEQKEMNEDINEGFMMEQIRNCLIMSNLCSKKAEECREKLIEQKQNYESLKKNTQKTYEEGRMEKLMEYLNNAFENNSKNINAIIKEIQKMEKAAYALSGEFEKFWNSASGDDDNKYIRKRNPTEVKLELLSRKKQMEEEIVELVNQSETMELVDLDSEIRRKSANMTSKNILNNPMSVEDYFYVAQESQKKKNYLKAVEFFGKVQEMSPNFKGLFENLALCHFQLGGEENFQKCIELFSEVIDKSNHEQMENAPSMKRKKRRRRLKNDSNMMPMIAYYYRALCFEKLLKYDMAIKDYSRGIELNETFEKFYLGRGLLLKSVGRLEEAQLDFLTLVDLKAINPRYLHLAGEVCRNLNKFKEAVKFYTKSINICDRPNPQIAAMMSSPTSSTILSSQVGTPKIPHRTPKGKKRSPEGKKRSPEGKKRTPEKLFSTPLSATSTPDNRSQRESRGNLKITELQPRNLYSRGLCFVQMGKFLEAASDFENGLIRLNSIRGKSSPADELKRDELRKKLKEKFEFSKMKIDLSRRDSTAEKNLEISFSCPITQELFEDPVILVESENTYERSAILEWFKFHNTDPLTRQRLETTQYISNRAINNAMIEWKKTITEEKD